MSFVKVAEPGELADGAMNLVRVGNAQITLASAGGTIYAFDNECTHDGGPLAEGELQDCVITCPWHFSSFDIRTGEIVDSPAEEPIAVYEVKIEADGIYVGGPAS